MSRQWRILGVDDSRGTQLLESLMEGLIANTSERYGIQLAENEWSLVAHSSYEAVCRIADSPKPFDCVLVDIGLGQGYKGVKVERPELGDYQKEYGTWVGKYIGLQKLPTRISYYTAEFHDLMAGFELPDLGFEVYAYQSVPSWGDLVEKLKNRLELMAVQFLSRTPKDRESALRLLEALSRDDLPAFLRREIELTDHNGESGTWRCGDLFIPSTMLAFPSGGSTASPEGAVQGIRRVLITALRGTPQSYVTAGEMQKCGGLVARSSVMIQLFEDIRQCAVANSTVLINGETGTGKELVARAIHDHSRRSEGQFLAVNCGALTESLLEDELFGHEKGAFTGADKLRKGLFELADGGTLFLDEVGDMTPQLQIKLLRILETREFRRVGGDKSIKTDARLVAATHRDLGGEVKAGRFREDLYYRLRVIPMRMPPLRERIADVRPIAEALLDLLAERQEVVRPALDDADYEWLESKDWPGNARELRNLLERALVLKQRAERFGDTLRRCYGPDSQDRGPPKTTGETFADLIEEAHDASRTTLKERIVRLLREHEGNGRRVAEILQTSYAGFRQTLKRLGIRTRDFHGRKKDHE